MLVRIKRGITGDYYLALVFALTWKKVVKEVFAVEFGITKVLSCEALRGNNDTVANGIVSIYLSAS